jgi:hypothetical protein
MADMTDYQKSTDYDLQPFFKAGDCIPLKWIHRKKGDMYQTNLILDDKETVDDADTSYATLSANSNGIAGTTFFQVGAQIMGIPDATNISSFDLISGATS